jgi:hypothetical protein
VSSSVPLPQDFGFCDFVNPEPRQCIFRARENATCKNPDKYSVVVPREHYTLTLDVKAGDFKRLDF